jgi:hypothetical protein
LRGAVGSGESRGGAELGLGRGERRRGRIGESGQGLNEGGRQTVIVLPRTYKYNLYTAMIRALSHPFVDRPHTTHF